MELVWFVSGLFVGTFVTFVGMSIIGGSGAFQQRGMRLEPDWPRCLEMRCLWYGAHYENKDGHEHEYAN